MGHLGVFLNRFYADDLPPSVWVHLSLFTWTHKRATTLDGQESGSSVIIDRLIGDERFNMTTCDDGDMDHVDEEGWN
jgi:hypothetical protein